MEREVVVITGGTAGVGRATARRFAVDGSKIAVLARGEDGLVATARELKRLGAAAVLPIRCDVADVDQIFGAAEQVERELGPVDIWINNAMTTVFGRFPDVTPREFARITEVTYLGTVWGTRAALDQMRPRNKGTIVQVGSALSYRAIPLQAAYCGAKFAIRAFTDALRSELLHDKIDVHLTMVQLPAINTPQFRHCANRMQFRPQPVPPIFQPELAADAIHYAAHHRRREIHLAWPTVKAVAGQRVAPGLLDHYLARRGFEGQLTGRPANDEQPENLFDPVPGDHGAHGDFELQARDSSLFARLSTVLGAAGMRALLAGGVGAVGIGAALAATKLMRR
jgi:short-subunit dehydrogenase